MEALLKAVSSADNIAVIVLMAANLGLLLLLRESHRSYRETLEKMTEVLTQLRIEFAKGRS